MPAARPPTASLSTHVPLTVAGCAHRVAVIGSVEESNDARFAFGELFDEMLDESSAFLKPDTGNPTTAADIEAAIYVYERLQELAISLIVVGRHTVYQGSVPFSAFEEWSRSNLDLARQLMDSQKSSIEELWKKAVAPEGSPARGSLPVRCNSAWFAEVFCGGKPPPKNESPWSSILAFQLYDSVALCASVPSLRKRLFSDEEEYEYDCGTAVHAVFGQKELLGGVKRPEALRSFLVNSVMAGLSANPEPYPIIIFTDPGQDLDDEVTMILLAHLVKLNYVRVIGVIGNMYPSQARAELAKGMLKRLGLPNVRVAAGTDGGCTDHTDKFRQSAASYMASPDEIEPDWDAMACDCLSKEKDKSVVVLCISSMTDCCVFFEKHEKLFHQKVHSVTIMGGVDLGSDQLSTEERLVQHFASDAVSPQFRKQYEELTKAAVEEGKLFKLIFPDTANNNTFDMNNAINLYLKLQLMEIRINVITRHAAYGAPMPRAIYDDMNDTGSPIARRLFNEQRTSIEDLWRRCNAVGAARQGLPNRCNKAWYCKTFLKGNGMDRGGDESIWDLVEQFNMYDVLALVYAVPSLAWRFFNPKLGVCLSPSS